MQLTLRFVVLIVALLAAVAASAKSGMSALTRLDEALNRIVEDDMERLLAITHSRRLFRSMVVLERDYILSRDAREREQFDKKVGSLASDLSAQLAKYARSMPAQDEAAIASIQRASSRSARTRTSKAAGSSGASEPRRSMCGQASGAAARSERRTDGVALSATSPSTGSVAPLLS